MDHDAASCRHMADFIITGELSTYHKSARDLAVG